MCVIACQDLTYWKYLFCGQHHNIIPNNVIHQVRLSCCEHDDSLDKAVSACALTMFCWKSSVRNGII